MMYDLAIIGAGPGGYVAAIYAAQQGMRVVCIEKEKTLGGTCLNVGCIPSKALLHSTEYYHRILSQGKQHGIEGQLSFNFPQTMERKRQIVNDLNTGISYLFKKNKIVHLQKEAKLLSPHEIAVGDEKIQAQAILLATGSEATPLPFLPFDEKQILSSTGALALSEVPQKMLLVGAGVIGLELGSVYRRLGSEITVIELLDRVTPTLDLEISKTIEQILKKQGFTFHLGCKIISGKAGRGMITLTTEQKEFTGNVVLVAIGRRPYTTGLGLEPLAIQKDEGGRIVIDQNFRTSIPSIYAIGDLVNGPMLAHKASQEAIAVIDLIMGKKVSLNYLAIPNIMYTWPEVASVGLTEQEAKDANLKIRIGKIPFKGIARARCSADEEGWVKIIGEQNTGRIIGLHIIGPNASEMIHEGVLALEKKMTLQDISAATHAHPTCSEAIKEAALAAQGHTLHF